MARRVTNISGLFDFIGYVVLCAPNAFPARDYLKPEEQMNLDRAFEELAEGVRLVERDFPNADQQRGLSALLAQSHEAYRSGDEVSGAHLLQDFQARIFDGRSAGV